MTGPHTVFFLLLAGCLTGEAILHLKQLTLIMMVCHLPQDPWIFMLSTAYYSTRVLPAPGSRTSDFYVYCIWVEPPPWAAIKSPYQEQLQRPSQGQGYILPGRNYFNTIHYLTLLQFLLELEKSSPELQIQFFLDPTAITEILEVWELFGQQAVDHFYYLSRTCVYYLYRKKQILLGFWKTVNLNPRKVGGGGLKQPPLPSLSRYSKLTH